MTEVTTYPELNRELLVKVVDHAVSADNWHQGEWLVDLDGPVDLDGRNVRDRFRESGLGVLADTPCGTAMCVAGFAVVDFGGWQPAFVGRSMSTSVVTHPDTGRKRFIFEVARELLGLTQTEAEALFHSKNRADDLSRTRDDILAGVYRGESDPR